jgi:hypothetical protein
LPEKMPKKWNNFAKFSKPQNWKNNNNNLTTQHGPVPSRLRPSNQGRPWGAGLAFHIRGAQGDVFPITLAELGF